MKIEIGKEAPDFTLLDQDGRKFCLSQRRGKTVVLYFYPRDNTPGCTSQACDFRDSIGSFSRLKAEVVGVSPDSAGSHAKFAAKYGLPFTLLSDPERKIAKLYGVYKKKVLYGKESMGIERSTFIIDPRGIIRDIQRKVRVKEHIDQVLAFLKG